MKDPKPMKFSMRMTEKLYEDLRAYAEADRRKMVDLVTLILEDYAACRGPVEHLPAETRPEPKSLVKVFRLSTMLPPGNPEENKKTEREKGQMEMDELKK